MITSIEEKLDELFILTQALQTCLSEDRIDEFQIIEKDFSIKMRKVIDGNTQQTLQQALPQLIKLEKLLQVLQDDASQKQASLKEQSLSLKRNKGKVNAYKKNAFK